MSAPRRVAVVLPPATAGGTLRGLNRCLQALGEAQARSRAGSSAWQAVLHLDPGALRPGDRALHLVNASGDPVRLEGPEGGSFTAERRAAFRAAALDILPPAREAAAVLDQLLPAAGVSLEESAAVLWKTLLGPAGLVVEPLPEAGPAAVVGEGPWAHAERIPEREVVWFSRRHLDFLAALGLPPSAALEGEARLRQQLVPAEAAGFLEALDALEQDTEAGLRRLEARVAEEHARLAGTWMRLRRDMRDALRDFRRRSLRSTRNRRGIRGAQVHALAQWIRPLDGLQEDRIGLLAAAALIRLDLQGIGAAVEAFAQPPRRGRLLLAAQTLETVSAEPGQGFPGGNALPIRLS